MKIKRNRSLNIKIIPPVHILPKIPLVGSGKISRRIIIQFIKTKKKQEFSDLLKKRVNYFPGPISKKISQKPIPFQTSAAKIIFYHWNNLGHPLVHHRPELNKTTSVAVERINKSIKSHGKEKILYAIDLVSKIFNAEWFKFRVLFARRKISLPDFFKFNEREITHLNKGFHDMPVSWFKECLKGEQYLRGKYNIRLKDKHPKTTKRLISIWKEFIGYEDIDVDSSNQIILCSKLLYSFSKRNKIDCLTLIDCIDEMLNKSKNFKPRHIGYLTNKIFWERQMPDELVRTNLVLSKRNMV